MNSYVVSVACFSDFSNDLYFVEAENELQAVINVLEPLEGWEEWPWESFETLKELQDELCQCDFAVAVKEISFKISCTLS